MLTLHALDLLGLVSLELMSFLDIRLVQILGIIVAEPAVEEFFALFALLLACTSVVAAAVFHL